MKTIIRYKGFKPEPQMKEEVTHMVHRLKHYDLGDSTVLSYVEFDGHQYLCSIDILLMGTSLYTTAVHENCKNSVIEAEIDICQKLERSQSSRYYEDQPWYME
jgi:hypothetical protein